jgi:hypothetical protein
MQAQARVMGLIEEGFASSTHVVRGRWRFQLLQLLQRRLLEAVDQARAAPWWLALGAIQAGCVAVWPC